MPKKEKNQGVTVKKSRKKPLQIDCEETMDISMAQDLHKKLGKALSEERSIVVNTSKVEKVDASIIQMFCALSQSAKGQQLALEWPEPSQKFLDSVRLLGLGNNLGLSAV